MTTESKPQKLLFDVRGMTCASCVARVEKALRRVPGVTEASVNLATEQARVAFPSGIVAIDDLKHEVEEAGYELVEPSPAAESDRARSDEQARLQRRWVVAGVVGAALMLGGMWRQFGFSHDWIAVQPMLTLMFLVALPVQLWAGWPIYASAWTMVRHRSADM